MICNDLRSERHEEYIPTGTNVVGRPSAVVLIALDEVNAVMLRALNTEASSTRSAPKRGAPPV